MSLWPLVLLRNNNNTGGQALNQTKPRVYMFAITGFETDF